MMLETVLYGYRAHYMSFPTGYVSSQGSARALQKAECISPGTQSGDEGGVYIPGAKKKFLFPIPRLTEREDRILYPLAKSGGRILLSEGPGPVSSLVKEGPMEQIQSRGIQWVAKTPIFDRNRLPV